MTTINPVTTLTTDGEIAVLSLNHPPVNALSAILREGLLAGLQQGFMGKAQLFNHNSVLVVCVSAVVLLALRAELRLRGLLALRDASL